MDAYVIYRDTTTQDGTLRVDVMRWGLVPASVVASSKGEAVKMADHFASRMFNARTDTLLEKRTFASLLSRRQTCIVALDGFFEWKAELGSSKKQPYFVYRRPYLLLAGLWSRNTVGGAKGHRMDTFTLLTTDASPSLAWLHSRMPVVLDNQTAAAWLHEPWRRWPRATHGARNSTGAPPATPSPPPPPPSSLWTYKEQMDLIGRLERTAHALEGIQCHAVTSQMTSLKFRSSQAVQALPKTKTLASFFSPKKKQHVAAAGIFSSSSSLSCAGSTLPTLSKPFAAGGGGAVGEDDRDEPSPSGGDDKSLQRTPQATPLSTKRPFEATAATAPASVESELGASMDTAAAGGGGGTQSAKAASSESPASRSSLTRIPSSPPSPSKKKAKRTGQTMARIDTFFVRKTPSSKR
jgi:putative SOS response-associated peptidase YedK